MMVLSFQASMDEAGGDLDRKAYKGFVNLFEVVYTTYCCFDSYLVFKLCAHYLHMSVHVSVPALDIETKVAAS